MKLLSWNVNGLKLAMGTGLVSYILDNDIDVVCLQETRVRSVNLAHLLPGYSIFANPAQWSKYGGTYTLVKGIPNYVKSGLDGYQDIEGRTQVIDMRKFIVINCYAPFAQYRMARIEEKLRYMDALYETAKRLSYKAPVIICGDLNIAHECGLSTYLIRKVPGFYIPEKDSFRKLLSLGFSDAVVHQLGPNEVVGLLDHFLVPKSILHNVSRIRVDREWDHTTHYPLEMILSI